MTTIMKTQTKRSQIEQWSRLPIDWQNDERMDALFSLFKDRELNPAHYDAKMKFWSETIISFCEDHSILQIDMPTISTRFRRKGKTPKCLDRVFEELLKQNRLMTSATFHNIQSSSWVSWTFNKLASPLTSWMTTKTPIDQESFIIRELVDKKAQQLVDVLQSNVCVPTFDCVLTYNGFMDVCHRAGLTDENSTNLIITHLLREKKILIDFLGDAKDIKVVKFIAPGCATIRPLTEIETSVILLRHSKERLEEQMKKSENQMELLLTDVHRHLKIGNRTAAMKVLKKKKLLEKEYEKKENTVEHLNVVLSKIEQTDFSSLVINAYSSGVQAHKELLRKTGLTPDAVENMIDEVQDVLDTQTEIDEALSRPTLNDFSDNADLEKELEDLLKEPTEPTKIPISMPESSVPTDADSFTDIELRLQKLLVEESSSSKGLNPVPIDN